MYTETNLNEWAAVVTAFNFCKRHLISDDKFTVDALVMFNDTFLKLEASYGDESVKVYCLMTDQLQGQINDVKELLNIFRNKLAY